MNRRPDMADIAYCAPVEFPAGPPELPRFIPDEETAYALIIPNAAMYVIEPSSRWTCYFFVSKIREGSDSAECTKRPIPAHWVESQLQLFGLKRPDRAAWRIQPSAGVLVALDTFPGAAL